jgi:hypothetical protein
MPYATMDSGTPLNTGPMNQTSRLVALKLIKLDTILVKEINSPVSFKLTLSEPLTDPQLHMLSPTTPWNPLKITACIGEWNDSLQAFNATVSMIEAPARKPTIKRPMTLRWGLVKRKRGFLSHD